MNDNTKETGEQVGRNRWVKSNWFYLIHLVTMAIVFGLTAFDFLPLAWGATVCIWIIMSRPMLVFLSLAFSSEHSDGGERIGIIICFLVGVLCLLYLNWTYFFSDLGSDRVKGNLFTMAILVAAISRPKQPS